MIDSGATGNFIHHNIVKRIKEKQYRKGSPYTLQVADGSGIAYQDGAVTHEVRTLMRTSTFKSNIVLDVTNTGGHHVILGTPFLDKHVPQWRSTLTSFLGRTTVRYRKPSLAEIQMDSRDELATAMPTFRQKDLASLAGAEVGELNGLTNTDKPQPELPAEYQQYAQVFKEDAENELPKHAPWDHKIEFLPDSKPKGTKLYNMRPDHREECRKYVDKLLKKGFIRKSEAPVGCSLFFVPKKGGKLRPVIDYRPTNENTKKDGHPLPLINDEMDALRGARYFTKMDLRGAYNLIRVREGDEWKTAFKTPFGLYEYLVMPFGLANAPATFQRHINEVLKNHLNEFVTAYMDDIIVYSRTLEEHKQHVKWVLEQLDKHDLRVELEKCEFHTQETDFLGYVIRPDEIKMSPDKIKAILEWPTPKNVKDIQSFLGFGNFYRRFISGYSGVVLPLTRLTRKDTPFVWGKDQQNAFQEMKERFTTAPVLTTYDYDKPTTMETDASDFAIGSCLSQPDQNGKLHPTAFYSRTMTAPELNYDIHDKELLSIVESLKHWKHYCAMPKHQVHVITDHKNLTHFTSTKVLNRRQVRWAEELASFHFRITYQKGSENQRADALSRRSDYMANKTHVSHAILQHNQDGTLGYNHTKELAVVLRVEDKSRRRELIQGYTQDKTLKQALLQDEDGLKTFNGKIFVPRNLQHTIISEAHHDGHRGVATTMEKVMRTYFIPRLRQQTEALITKCDICRKIKNERHKPYGLLQPLRVPEEPWHSISMDFITDLPKSREPGNTTQYDTIFVVTDRFSKYGYFIPTVRSGTAEDVAFLLHRHVIAQHGAPKEIISDRDKLFTSKFWKATLQLMGTKRKLSTSFHPQTDGQTERLNQTLEQFLRVYVNKTQDNWSQLLPMAQFTYNNSTMVTGDTPFYINFGKHPTIQHDAGLDTTNVPKANEIHELRRSVIDNLASQLKWIQQKTILRTNKSRSAGPDLKEGDTVYLRRKNIKTKRPCNKLDHTKLGPFKIQKVLGPVTFELELPVTMKIHPVFHKSLLEPAHGNEPTSEPIKATQGDNQEYEVEKILDHRKQGRTTQYLIKWKEYSDTENTWEPLRNLQHCRQLLNDYYHQRQ